MIDINVYGTHGITVGARKDGSRAILWDSGEITWHCPDEFNAMLGA